MKVKIKSWNAVSSWNWDLGDNDNCSICMTSYESPCSNCKIPGDDCPPIEGTCGHFFHLHCIYKWLESNDKCPLDREVWTEKTISIINNNNNNSNLAPENSMVNPNQNSNLNMNISFNN